MTSITQAGPAVSAGPAAPRTRTRRRDTRKLLEILLFVGPALIVFVGFVILPVALAAVYSFFNWNGLGPLERFIGIDNYIRAFGDPLFLKSIGNNFTIAILSLLIQGPLAITVALLLNRKMRGRTIIRAAIFVPYVLSEVIAGLSFKLLLSPRGGLNAFLESIGLGDLAQPWLAQPDTALWVMFGILTWKYLGFAILLMLAGLQGVPEELSEAAAIDGASWWKIQWHITIPLLGPTIRIWAFLSIIGSLQLFDMVWVTTRGGPVGATSTMATYMIQYGQGNPGYGSAVAVILFLISLLIAVLYQRHAMRRDLGTEADTRGDDF
ncbi:carbohydrate ABC transporter permease [Protaetiibacter intestinalis]|uniref:Sugar ABC transporter permease n=1 Tax=Protaetiibacter intestinalis TaxID=2419774 RepID=A0A387BAN6_9MICO|nr:sugar ABC transporter permease [Protaetiibacter intestinalis]AYF98195.1 sugar ABC transporter permease [Protaetiibacter intestinalis]